ncbi:MAG: zinc ribbon domain-containing protein [Acidobacteria bacterium]|nr:zinc ribbon domain-containing protein [Acidobacteriota bacterium]
MPIFEYVCAECHHRFETIVYGSTEPECPSCRGRKLEKQLSTFAVGVKSASPAGELPSPCNNCGDPRGPGACMMDQTGY